MISGAGSLSGKAHSYELEGLGSILSGGGVEIFLHCFVSRLILGFTQPPIKGVPGIKAPKCRTSHPTSS